MRTPSPMYFATNPPKRRTVSRDALLIGRNDLAQVLGVHAGGECRRADEVGEHHRDLAALGAVLRGRLEHWTGSLRHGGALRARIAAQSSDGIEQLRRCPTAATPSSFRSSAVKLGRTVLVNLVLAECRLVLSRPRLRSQPPTSMITPELRPALMIGETACLGHRS